MTKLEVYHLDKVKTESQAVVETLEALLVRAQKGEITNIGICYSGPRQKFGTCLCVNPDAYGLFVSMIQLENRIKALVHDEDD